MALALRVTLLLALLAAPAVSSSASPVDGATSLDALLGVGVLTADADHDDAHDGSERVRVLPCSAPGPACETEPVDIRHHVRIEVLPGFVGTTHVDLVRDGTPVQRLSCTSTGLAGTACDVTPGTTPPGAYVLRSTADPGTVGAWAVMVRYA